MTRTPLAVAAAAAAVLLGATVAAGGWLYLMAVLVTAGVALVWLHAALAATGPRPVLLAGLVCALGAPLWAFAQPEAQLGRLPLLAAATLLAAFLLLISGPRRHGVTLAAGATVLMAVVVGLAAAALTLLRGPDGGLEWATGFVALVVVPELVGAVLHASGRAHAADAGRYVAYGVVAGAVIGLLAPPLTLMAVIAMAATVVVCRAGAAALERALSPADSAPTRPSPVQWLLTAVLAAPVAFFTAVALQT